MKKILFSFLSLFVAAPASLAVIQKEQNQTRFDPIDKFNVPYEMIEASKEMETIIAHPEEVNDINYIQNVLTRAIVMMDEIYNENFFNEIRTKMWEILNHFSDELKNITTTPGSNFYQDISKQEDLIGKTFHIKIQNPKVWNLFIEYEALKREEAIQFFDKYDRRITKLTYDLQQHQKAIDELNVRNAEIDEILKGLSKENEIINNIFKILNFNLELIKAVREMYDNGRTNIEVYYDSAAWHADNWGLGFIPFYGTGFNVNFKNNMGNAVRGIETYVDTFLKIDSSNYNKFVEMRSGLEGLRDQVLAIDPLSDEWIGDLLEETGLGETESDLLGTAVSELADKGLKNMGPIGKTVSAVMDFIGGGFQSKKLADTFNNDLKPAYNDVSTLLNENDSTIAEAYKKVLTTQKLLSAKFETNSSQQAKLRDELQANLNEIQDRNDQLENLKNNIVEAKSQLVKTMNMGIFADNYYYWQLNIIADISFNSELKTTKNYLKSERLSIEVINSQKNMLYDRLVGEINNSLPNSEILTRLKEKNSLSNENYKYIQSI